MKMTASEEQMLVRRTLAGSAPARTRLIEDQTALVATLAKRYLTAGVELEELKAVGDAALVAELERLADYDPDRGRLATWLRPSIAGAIRKAAARETRSRGVLKSLPRSDEGEGKDEPEHGRLDPNLAELLGDEDDDAELARPGADSSRDPYLRGDRFLDVKEALLVRLQQKNALATIHEPTWLKMTRSPAEVAVLKQVRDGVEGSMAHLEQEYSNFAPAPRLTRSPRAMEQRDSRSDALARITRHAARAGSLPERAQWAALGVPDAVSAVAHFRRWVLGGEPSQLWPDPVELLLAAEHWVEDQAKREPDPDPTRILAYGDGKLRAIARGGKLDTLKYCARELTQQFGWPEEHAVRFIIIGYAPSSAKLSGGVRLGGPYRALDRVLMDIDPRTSPAEVARLYGRWRKTLALLRGGPAYPGRDRPMKDRTLALAVFVEERWQPGMPWSDLLAVWNEEHPDWRFPDESQDPGGNNFANHARQAWSRLSEANWPAEFTATPAAAQAAPNAGPTAGTHKDEPKEPPS
jgi:hypothetical protein